MSENSEIQTIERGNETCFEPNLENIENMSEVYRFRKFGNDEVEFESEYENCLDLMTHWSFMLCIVPQKYRTYELCLKASASINYIPKQHITPEICFNAAIQNIHSFTYIPEEFQTYEMCLECVKNINPDLTFEEDVYRLIPQKFQTDELMACVKDVYKDCWRSKLNF